MTKGNQILEVKDLHVEVEGKEILKGLNLTVDSGVNVIMGPNGSGKSTLANALMGHPKYKITKGIILFKGEDVTNLPVNERAKKGLFLSFQYPKSIPGVTISNFLRTSINSIKGEKIPIPEFRKLLESNMEFLSMDRKFMYRYLNDGFSGGEKKKSEILQLLMLKPTLAILDETDSGLDIDALRIVSEGVNKFNEKEDKCILIITHYKRILEHIPPKNLFILMDGKIILEGGPELVDKLEKEGYEWIEE